MNSPSADAGRERNQLGMRCAVGRQRAAGDRIMT